MFKMEICYHFTIVFYGKMRRNELYLVFATQLLPIFNKKFQVFTVVNFVNSILYVVKFFRICCHIY